MRDISLNIYICFLIQAIFNIITKKQSFQINKMEQTTFHLQIQPRFVAFNTNLLYNIDE